MQDSTGRSTEIETICLDDFADDVVTFEKGIFVKIDVQGAEALVVEGARRLLARPSVGMLLEFWPEAVTRSGVDPGEFLRSLEQSGFLIHEVGGGTCRPRVLGSRDVLEACRTGPELWMNLLLTKTRRGLAAEGTGQRG